MEAEYGWNTKIKKMPICPKIWAAILSLIYNRTMCLIWQMTYEQRIMVCLNYQPQYRDKYQENTSYESTCWSMFPATKQEGTRRIFEFNTGTVALTVHLWYNIYKGWGQCHTWMQADHDYRRQLAVSIIHVSVGNQQSINVGSLRAISLNL